MKKCTIEGCGRRHKAHGLCLAHYKRKLRGEPIDDGKFKLRGLTLDERLALFTNKDLETGCIEWTGKLDDYGYAVCGPIRIHRAVLERKLGRKLGSLFALHSCDNRKCVNKDHLHPGTAQENMDEKMERGRHRTRDRDYCGATKLTADKVLAIRSEYAAGGISQHALSAKYGVHRQTIYEITNRKTWKHI